MLGEDADNQYSLQELQAEDGIEEYETDQYRVFVDTDYDEIILQEHGNEQAVIASDTYVTREEVRTWGER